ncbi:putative integral membrane protein [Clavispora lusitaniae]|uniref:putative integral membrane protein n=1 Tax=Clavispora lusitaniae TaxID=36911 RepID=UPI00202C79F9|nr:putative integral membrane protein [Clavispora lusitaniae]
MGLCARMGGPRRIHKLIGIPCKPRGFIEEFPSYREDFPYIHLFLFPSLYFCCLFNMLAGDTEACAILLSRKTCYQIARTEAAVSNASASAFLALFIPIAIAMAVEIVTFSIRSVFDCVMGDDKLGSQFTMAGLDTRKWYPVTATSGGVGRTSWFRKNRQN